MRFSCDSCSAKFTIADEKVRGKVVAVKCSKCGARITVNGKSLVEPVEEAHEEERTRVASLSDMEALRASAGSEAAAAPAKPVAAPPPAAAPASPKLAHGWYAIIDGKQLGPLPAQETLDHLKAGRLSERTYVWRDGQADWKRVEDVPELAAQLKAAAPPAPPAPVPVPARAAAPAVAPEPAAPEPTAAPAAAQAPADAGAGADEPTPPPDDPSQPPQDLESSKASQAAAKPSAKALDQMLFSGEFEDVPTMTGRPLDAAALVADDLDKAAEQSKGPWANADPFASVSDSPNMAQPMQIGEQTRFFMQKAGVTRRNPPWKIALAVFLFIGVPVALLYALSQMKIVNLEITQVDESTGQEISTPVFSSEGMSGLRNMLLGNKQSAGGKKASKSHPKVAQPKPAEPVEAAKPSDGQGAVVAKADIKFNSMTDAERLKLQGLYAEGHGLDKPKVDTRMIEKPAAVDGQAGLEPKVISEVIGKNLKAFQVCTETELRRNPTFKGGKIKITVTIGTSGVVTGATIDRQDINGSDLGSCLKDKAKRVVFPRFEGEPFDVEIPLVLTGGA